MGAALTRQDRRPQMDGKQTAPSRLWGASRRFGHKYADQHYPSARNGSGASRWRA